MSGHNARPSEPRACKGCGKPATKYREWCINCHATNRTRLMAYGRWDNGRAPVQPVVEHIANLTAAGMSLRCIAALAGTNSRWCWSVRSDPSRRWVSKRLSAAVLAIPIPSTPELAGIAANHMLIDGTGTARRLQALMAVGYTQREVIERLGMAPTMSYRLWHTQHLVFAATSQKVAALYDELAMVRPPDTWMARRAAARAAERGWVPPLAWDEYTIDDPAAQPQPWRPEPLPERTIGADFVEVLEDYRSVGHTDEAIAARLGIQLESLYRRLDRLGLPRAERAS